MATKTALTPIFKRPFWKKLFNCLLLALLLTGLDYFALYLPWLVDGQDVIVQSTKFKKSRRSIDTLANSLNKNRIARDFLLIDVSNDMAVYCDTGKAQDLGLPVDAGSPPGGPCSAGVDLKKLTPLFKWLSEHPDEYNLVVCDIIMDSLDSTAETNELLGYLVNMVQHPGQSKIIFAARYDVENERFHTSSFFRHLPLECKGAVNEELTGDRFFSCQLSYNKGKIKSLPLLMLEKIDHYAIVPGSLGFSTYKRPDSTTLTGTNRFIPEMLFPSQDFDSLRTAGSDYGSPFDTTVGKMDLWQTVLRFDSSSNYYLQEVLRTSTCRNIFIGSFNHDHPDVHKTLYGEMDGGIVLLNIYYNLVFHENRFDVSYHIVMFFCFCIIAWLILHHLHNPYHGRFLLLRMGLDILFEEMHYFLLFGITLMSSIVFDRASNAIALLTFILIADRIIKAYRVNKKTLT